MTSMDSFFAKVCQCGVIHVCFGPTMLNLSPEVLIAVTETLKSLSSEVRVRLTSQTLAPVIQGNFPPFPTPST